MTVTKGMMTILNCNFYFSFCIAQRTSRSNRTMNKLIAVICEEDVVTHVSENTYGYLMALSAIFLIVTAGIYASRDDLR